MKTLKALFVSLALLATVLTTSADDKSSGLHWYQLVVAQPYTAFVGTSKLSESELAAALSKGDGFIELDNLLYQDNNAKYKDWHEWNPNAESRIYLQAKAVISFQPLVGDPRQSSGSVSK